jgi:hypothetical protein
MIWIAVIGIVGYILFRFFSELNKDKADLQGGIANKFNYVVQGISNAAFGSKGDIQYNSQREFNLYKQPSNQIVIFQYGTGILTIIWKYKYFQKEISHEKNFFDVRNLSVFEQQNIAFQIISEMASAIEKHQVSVLGQVDSEEELLLRLHRIIETKGK